MTINQGKYFAKQQENFAVFILGMRIHNLWNIKKWAGVYRLIPRMLNELEQENVKGYLGNMSKISFREPLIIQYWRSIEDLQQYARNPKQSHLEVWRTFNKLVGSSKDIGIWHETYEITPGRHENIYVNMPFKGMGQFTPLLSIKDFSKDYKNRFREKEVQRKG